MNRTQVYALFIKALEAGARQLGPFEVEWDIAGRCLLPVRREITARKTHGVTIVSTHRKRATVDKIEHTLLGDIWTDQPIYATYGREKEGPYTVQLTAKCRKCDQCLKERKLLWARRALVETAQSSRTWFGTLTCSPEWHERFAAHARQKYLPHVLDELPFADQLLRRHAVIGAELQKMLKRLRKARHQFRYFLVLEAHASGLPHYHMLVHEVGAPITKRTLDGAWPFGFTVWRLSEGSKAVWYTAKYLGKSSAARVRASTNYGSVRSVSTVGSGDSLPVETLTYHSKPSAFSDTAAPVRAQRAEVASPARAILSPQSGDPQF